MAAEVRTRDPDCCGYVDCPGSDIIPHAKDGLEPDLLSSVDDQAVVDTEVARETWGYTLGCAG